MRAFKERAEARPLLEALALLGRPFLTAICTYAQVAAPVASDRVSFEVPVLPSLRSPVMQTTASNTGKKATQA